MIPTTIRIRCQHPYVRIAQVFRIGQLSLHWITPGRPKSTNASSCGFFDSKEAALHRGISRQMRSLITRRSNLELTIAIEQWTPLSSSLGVRRNKDSTELVSTAVRNWYFGKSLLFSNLRPFAKIAVLLSQVDSSKSLSTETDFSMACAANDDEIFFHIPSEQASRLNVMDLQILGISASLASPAITLEHLLTKPPKGIPV